MRNLINLIEGRKTPMAAPLDAVAITNDLKSAALLLRQRTGIDWNSQWAQEVLTRLRVAKADHTDEQTRLDPEDLYSFNAREYLIEYVSEAYRRYSTVFTLAKPEIKQMIIDYQNRHGARLDDEAGFESDFHFIESSDWLTAMDQQSKLVTQLGFTTLVSLGDVPPITDALRDFAQAWESADEEPQLAEQTTEGLSCLIPLLMLMVR